MLFYHYNTEQFDELKSLVAQGRKGTNSQVERGGLTSKLELKVKELLDKLSLGGEHRYDRHISLFIEPIPDTLAKIFDGKHEFWQSGLKLIEHVISIDDLPDNISFSLEESTEKTKLLYEKQDWGIVKNKPEMIAVYKKEIADVQKAHGYIGHGKRDMIKACTRYTNTLERSYRHAANLAKRHPEDGIYSRYASCVPHLMIYPGYKTIPVLRHRELILK